MGRQQNPVMPEDDQPNSVTNPTYFEKASNGECTSAAETKENIHLVNEVQLTAATGGTELSCYRCTVPFGVVVLIAGIVVTAVAYSFNSHGSTISYIGLVLLAAGFLLLSSSFICWKVNLERKKEQRRESQAALVANQEHFHLNPGSAESNVPGSDIVLVLGHQGEMVQSN